MNNSENNNDNNLNPLESVTIGKVKQNKFSFIIVIFLFILFIGIIYFLPDLNVLYEKYILGKTDDVPSYIENTNTNTNTNTTPEEDNKYILFGTDETLTVDNVVFSNVKMNNNTLTISVFNKNSKEVSLEKNNLFFDLYASGTVVKRVALEDTVAANGAKTLTFNLDNENFEGYYVNKYTDENYSLYEAKEDENNISSVVCSNDYEVLKYTFTNQQLLKVSHEVTIPKTDPDYTNMYNYYNVLSTNFESGKIRGAVASLVVSNENMIYNMDIDYNLLSANIDNKYYFSKDSTVSKVVFIMDAHFFSCI